MSEDLPPILGRLLRIVRGTVFPADLDADLRQWDELLRVARAGNVLAAAAESLRRAGGLEHVPSGPRQHFLGALKLAQQQSVSVRWEALKLGEALRDAAERVVLLKGAAYLADGLPFSAGRMFSDVDILVPDTRIDEIEQVLMRHGWATTHHTAYDQTYYRRWMHEIPPMRHLARGTVVDVHHRILPRSSRYAPDPASMLARARPSSLWPDVYVLCREDMVLHSATHLFHEGELHNGWRDLIDIDRLVASFASVPDFWSGLAGRARELGLEEPLYVVLRQAARLLGTAIPAEAMGDPAVFGRSDWRDPLYHRALRPMHASCDLPGTALARWLAYTRAHALRMPPHLLTYHLARKAMRRWSDPDEESAA